jgi:hypothetical protein
MSDGHAHGAPASPLRRFPPLAELVTLSLALIVVGGVVMATYVPRRPPLFVPSVLLAVASALLVGAVIAMTRLPSFAFRAFFQVEKWMLLAYVFSAGMIEFAFIKNHTRGAPLVVVTLMLVVFALDVAFIVAFTVARYQEPTTAA